MLPSVYGIVDAPEDKADEENREQEKNLRWARHFFDTSKNKRNEETVPCESLFDGAGRTRRNLHSLWFKRHCLSIGLSLPSPDIIHHGMNVAPEL
jgi:hypothetical protein